MENKNIYWRQSIDVLDCGSGEQYRNKSGRMKLWRHNSLGDIVSHTKKKNITVYESTPSDYENMTYNTSNEISKTEGISKKNKGNNIVSIVLVEAKGLPEPPEDGSSHNLYCKIRLGTETLKSKSVPNTRQPEWRERFQILRQNDNLLRISLWDKGKLKNFMGSCVLDLSRLEKDRTYEIWQELDDGYGSVHLSVTMFTTAKPDRTPDEHANTPAFHDNYLQDVYDLTSNWNLVGKLQVKVIMAKGLYVNHNAYCVLELDNERVQTHCAQGPTEPVWNKSYIFNVYDVTSTLDLQVYDGSLVSTIRNEPTGKISIPLLRIHNGETRWYALKDKYKRMSAKGNCPRILLEMCLIWNPIKGSLRLFQPKELKYIKESPKFDISLVYKNLEFIKDKVVFLKEMNENFKCLFEWENQEFSAIALFIWLLFWYYFKLWIAPLMLLTPFVYFWVFNKNQQEKSFMRGHSIVDVAEQNENSGLQNEKSFTGKIQNLPDITSTIAKGTEYAISVAQRLYNLASFKVPFLSYLVMLLLIITSIVFYLIPYNYLMMTLGVYKFTRKYMNPQRVSNNDILDFISRIPDNELMKDWKELNVPEPIHPKRIT